MQSVTVEVFATSWIEINQQTTGVVGGLVEVFATSWIEIFQDAYPESHEYRRGLCDLVD